MSGSKVIKRQGPPYLPPPPLSRRQEVRLNRITYACVASVSVSFGRKERPRNGIFGRYFWPRDKWNESQKKKKKAKRKKKERRGR